MKMKIVIAIIMLHYNIDCLKAQIPIARSMDYIRDYYGTDGNANNGVEESADPESYDYSSDEPMNEQRIELNSEKLWEAVLKLLKNKYKSSKPERPPTKYESYSGKGPAMYSYKTPKTTMRPLEISTMRPRPKDHRIFPYDSGLLNNNALMPGDGNTSQQTCILKKTMCMKRCTTDPRCKKECSTRFPC